MEVLRKDKGITMVALVVTVIVLLILAGVTIGVLTGDSGIIKQAENVANKQENMEARSNSVIDELYKEQTKYKNEIHHINTDTGNNNNGGSEGGGEEQSGLKITANPAKQDLIEGNMATFSVVAEGANNISYQWYYNTIDSTKGGTLISGATSRMHTVSTTTQMSGRYYYCMVTDTENSKSLTSNTGKLTVVSKVIIASQPTNVTSYGIDTAGNSATFSVVAQGEGELSYQWYYSTTNSVTGGTAISGANQSTYTVNPTTTNLNGRYYYCVVTQKYSVNTETVASNAAQLIVAKAYYSITSNGVTAYYATLEEAHAAAVDGDTIVVIADVTDSSAPTITKNVKLDNNGKTLTKTTNAINVIDNASLTLKGTGTVKSLGNIQTILSSGTSTVIVEEGTIIGSEKQAVANTGNGKIVINGGTLTRETGTDSTVYSGENGTIEINGGEITNSVGGAISIYKGTNLAVTNGMITSIATTSDAIVCNSTHTGSVTITGGIITGKANGIDSNGIGTVEVTGNDTKIIGETKHAISNDSNGKIIINGGHLISEANTDSTILSGADGTVEINGGEITNSVGTVLSIYKGSSLTIRGGSITGGTDGINCQETHTGSVTITGGNITGANNGIVNSGTGTMEISGDNTKIIGKTTQAIRNDSTGKIIINGGMITRETGANSAIYGGADGTIEINGGEITNPVGGAISIYKGTYVKVTGGTIKSGNSYAIRCQSTHTGIVDIIGGTLVGVNNVIANDGTGTVNVGSSTVAVSKTNPVLQGGQRGILTSTGITNFYNGVLKGTVNPPYTGALNLRTGYELAIDDKSTTDDGLYHAYLQESAPVAITKNISDLTVIEGNSVTFTVEAQGSGTITYQWYENTANSATGGTAITGATNNSYSFATTSDKNGKYYYCVVTQNSAAGTKTVTSNVAQLTVQTSYYSITANGTTTYYPNLAIAHVAAVNGDTIKVTKDVTDTSAATITKNVKLDNNGKTLTKTTNVINVIDNASLTLKGTGTVKSVGDIQTILSSGTSTVTVEEGTIIGSERHAIASTGNGRIVINGGKITRETGTNTAIYSGEDGTIEINGGEVAWTEGTAVSVYKGTNLTVTNGTIIGLRGITCNTTYTGTVTVTGNSTRVAGTESQAIYNLGNGKIVVNGGTIIREKNTASTIYSGEDGIVEINGGTIIGTEGIAISIYKGTNLTVTNGTITGNTQGIGCNTGYTGTVTISGDNTEIVGKTSHGISNAGNGKIVVNGGYITRETGTNATIYSGEDGIVEINGGEFINPSSVVLSIYKGTNATIAGGAITGGSNGISCQGTHTGIVKITGGTSKGGEYGVANTGTGTVRISGTATVEGTAGILNSSSGNVNIEGGNIIGTERGILNSGAGSVAISGGKVKANGDTSMSVVANSGTGTIELVGGEIEAVEGMGMGLSNPSGKLKVSSGIINAKLAGVFVGSSTALGHGGIVEITGGTITSASRGGVEVIESTEQVNIKNTDIPLKITGAYRSIHWCKQYS